MNTSWAFLTAARTLWQEARSEDLAGRQAVAAVLWNRLRSGRWGHNLAEVCLYPAQFSGWLSHDPNRMATARLADDDPVLLELQHILDAAETAPDPTNGAMFYYAPKLIPEPTWAKTMHPCGQFGTQLFFKDSP